MASETLADIVAEMRELAADIESGNAVVGQTVWRNYADRIEAAAKRERVEVEADALSAGGLVEDMRHKPGNAAAMREALGKVKDAFETDTIYAPTAHPSYEMVEEVRKVYKTVLAALAKPPRNCDRFNGDYKMLHTAWFDWSGSPSGQNPDGTAKMAFGEWLLAPAKKGGAK